MSFLCRKTRKVKGRTRESSGYEARTRSRTMHSLYAKLFFLTACTYAEPLHTIRSCRTARVYVLSLRPVRATYGPRAVISSPVGRVRMISYHIISYHSSTSKYNSSTQHITPPRSQPLTPSPKTTRRTAVCCLFATSDEGKEGRG